MVQAPEGVRVVWAPLPGSQEEFLSCPLQECLLHGSRGPGKGLPLDEPVYTNMGPTPIRRVKVGTLVLCPDGTKSRVIGVFPQGVRPTYEITFDDGAKARCDDEHLWPIHTQGQKTKRRNHAYGVMPMAEVVQRFRRGKRLHVPTVDVPVKMIDRPRLKEWPVEPYLLGLLLGDGSFGQAIRFTTADPELALEVSEAGAIEDCRKGEVRQMRWRRGPVWEGIQSLGIMDCRSGDKYVPRLYMIASVATRLAVLQGLMDTDGTVDRKGYCSFTSKSIQLARDVQELVWSMGGKATLTEKVIKNVGSYWNVYIQPAGKFEPFRLERKLRRINGYQHGRLWRRIVSIEELGEQETVCIRIDHPLGLFITRDFTVTHNSDALLMDFAQGVGRGYGAAWRGVLFRETYPQLADLVAKSEKWFRLIFPDASFNRGRMEWEFATGEVLMFRHMKRPDDYWSHHGQEYPWIAWDELTNWASPECYLRMFSCNRSSTPGVPRRIRSATNPYGKGTNWVKARFRLEGEWWKTQIVADGLDKDGNPEPPRAAIHGHLSENRHLLEADPHYARTVMASATNKAMAAAWLNGDWNVIAGGMFDDVWSYEHNSLPRFEIPTSWRIDRAFDWGSSAPFAVAWCAESDGTDLELSDGRTISTVRGDVFMVEEWYGWSGQPNQGLRMLAVDVAKGIVEREVAWGWTDPGGSRVHPGPADSSIFAVENGGSIAIDMERPVRLGNLMYPGVEWLRADKRPGSRKKGWERMRQMIRDAQPQPGSVREEPGFFVVGERCPQFLRTVLSLPRDEKDLDDVATDSEDHLGDCLRYKLAASGNYVTSGQSVGMF